ncbi:hypothetical protein [Shewanella sp. MSW]|uniref:hypothetical protein n=1 Tax=Shewanella sp. MSW TaxID=2569536 RepID=UPI00164238D4|nr:hypothetical protein [Shewanella sp. MSW]
MHKARAQSPYIKSMHKVHAQNLCMKPHIGKTSYKKPPITSQKSTPKSAPKQPNKTKQTINNRIYHQRGAKHFFDNATSLTQTRQSVKILLPAKLGGG